jgi:hypothetical protein
MTAALSSIIPHNAVTRIRVLSGEDTDADRRGDKQPIAISQCSYYGPDEQIAVQCIEALRESDERLRNRPEELMLWDWRSTYWEPDMSNEHGGGTVLLGVAWYDEEFYRDRRVAWFGPMHQRIYQQIGVPLEAIEVTHYLLDEG